MQWQPATALSDHPCAHLPQGAVHGSCLLPRLAKQPPARAQQAATKLWPQWQKATLPHHLQAMWDLGHCDKKRCTGTRLMRLHVVSEIRLGTPFPGVILSPNGKRCVSVEDQELIAAKGLAVVDCSWNRLDDVPFSEPGRG